MLMHSLKISNLGTKQWYVSFINYLQIFASCFTLINSFNVNVSASPGRLIDHLENTKGFNLRTLKYLVCY